MPIDIQLTPDQVDEIRTALTEDNNLETDERQLLNGLLEMAQNHTSQGIENLSWRYIKPQLEGS
jgi:hypothetical protein